MVDLKDLDVDVTTNANCNMAIRINSNIAAITLFQFSLPSICIQTKPDSS